MNIFIICPVRNVSQEINAKIATYVQMLERQGHNVYWPLRDTDQDDSTGFNICMDSAMEIRLADEVHIWYDPASQGSIFDLGALVMTARIIGPSKRIVLINRDQVLPTVGESFTNVVLELTK